MVTPQVELTAVAAGSYEEAEAVAVELVSQGIEAIELCGGFGNRGTARIADAVAGKAELRNTHREARFGGSPITADQRLEFRQQGAAQMQKLVDATRDLYAVLTPAQKAGAGNLLGPRCAAW